MRCGKVRPLGKDRTGQSDNSGFSLVEILVAVAILVLCAAPLLRAFVISVNSNAMARESLSAVTLAENIMEEIKASGVEAYAVPSGDYANIGGNSLPVYEARYNSYSFDGRDWSIEAVMTPSDATYLEAGSEQAFHAQELPELSGMNGKTDAVYMQGADERWELLESYAALHPGVSAYDLEQEVVTTYRFRIAGTAGLDTVQSTVTYTDAAGNVLSQETRAIFDTVQNGERLKRLYIFYVPADRPADLNAHEKVILENPDALPVEVWLVRQGAGGRPLNLSVSENLSQVTTALSIYTNLDTGLGSHDFGEISRNGITHSLASAQAQFGLYGLEGKKTSAARLYEVVVMVRAADGSDAAVLSGTALP